MSVEAPIQNALSNSPYNVVSSHGVPTTHPPFLNHWSMAIAIHGFLLPFHTHLMSMLWSWAKGYGQHLHEEDNLGRTFVLIIVTRPSHVKAVGCLFFYFFRDCKSFCTNVKSSPLIKALSHRAVSVRAPLCTGRWQVCLCALCRDRSVRAPLSQMGDWMTTDLNLSVWKRPKKK